MTILPSEEIIEERLKSLRKAKGVSQEEVARAIGISFSAYTKYENNGLRPKDSTKIKIAEYYGVTVDELFY